MQYLRSNQPNNLVVCSKKAQMLRIYMYDSMAGYTDIDDSVNVVAFCNSISLQDGHRISSTDGLPLGEQWPGFYFAVNKAYMINYKWCPDIIW